MSSASAAPSADAPEIDGSVHVDEDIPAGEFSTVTIKDWRGCDLVAAR